MQILKQFTLILIVVSGCSKDVAPVQHPLSFQARFEPEEKKLCGAVRFDQDCTVTKGESNCKDATLKINNQRVVTSREFICDYDTGAGGVVLTDEELAESPISIRLLDVRAKPHYIDYSLAVPSQVSKYNQFEARDVRLGNYLSPRAVNVLSLRNGSLALIELDGREIWSTEACCDGEKLIAAELEATSSTGSRSIVVVEKSRVMSFESDSGRLVTEYTLHDVLGDPMGIQAGFVGSRPAARLLYASGPIQIYLDTGTKGYASAILTPKPTEIQYSTRFGRDTGVAQYTLADNSLVHEALEGLLQISGVETSEGELFLCDYEVCVSQDDISVEGPYIGRLKRIVDDIEAVSGVEAPDLLAWPGSDALSASEFWGVFAFPWSPTNQVEDRDGFDSVNIMYSVINIYRSGFPVLDMDLNGKTLSALISAEPNEAKMGLYLAMNSPEQVGSTKSIHILRLQAPAETPSDAPFRLYAMGTPGNLFYFRPLDSYE